MTTVLKLVYNDDTRRVSMSTGSISFAAIRTRAAECFPCAFDDGMKLMYTDDDGDAITIVSEEDIQEALRQFGGSTLRISVSKLSAGLVAFGAPAEDAPEVAEEETGDADNILAVHAGVTCDSCNENPIVGVRWKCAVCRDYDLCENCEATDKHTEHPMLKIRTPQQAPTGIIVCLSEDGESHPVAQTQTDSEHQPFRGQFFGARGRGRGRGRRCGRGGGRKFWDAPHGLHHGPHHGPPHGPHHGPPHGPHHGPPHGPHHGPPHGPHHGPHHGPPGWCVVSDMSQHSEANEQETAGTGAQPLMGPSFRQLAHKCGRKWLREAAKVFHGPQKKWRRAQQDREERELQAAIAASVEGQPCEPMRASSKAKNIIGKDKEPKPKAKFVSSSRPHSVSGDEAGADAASSSDEADVPRSGRFIQKWTLRNNGRAAWPEGSRFVHVGGPKMGFPSEGIPASAAPGEDCTITAILTVPSDPDISTGRHTAYFRLITPSYRRFGHRVWCDVFVDKALSGTDVDVSGGGDVDVDADANFDGDGAVFVELQEPAADSPVVVGEEEAMDDDEDDALLEDAAAEALGSLGFQHLPSAITAVIPDLVAAAAPDAIAAAVCAPAPAPAVEAAAAPEAPAAPTFEEASKQLCSMGFGPAVVEEVLRSVHGKVQDAVDRLVNLNRE